MEKKKTGSAPKIGMDRGTHPAQLENTQYTFCLNCNTESETGDYINITNEPSNYLSVDLPSGYKVIGYRKHPTKQLFYVFLTNPATGFSSVGYIEANINDLEYAQDTEQICEDCDYYNILPTPLEDITQAPYNTYIEFFNDLCNKDFNFSIEFPIKHIEIKIDKLGTNIYWVDNNNPDRWFNAENIPYYKLEGEIICGIDNTVPTCVNVDKMLQQPNYVIPTVTPEALQIGGNLRMGTYEFIIAPSDIAGNEISDYTSITQPIPIFDPNNRVLAQTELDSFTNYGIRLSVENLDKNFHYYKVVVIERVAVNQAESYYVEGIHPISDTSIFYTSTQTGTENLGGVTQRISYNRVMARKLRYEHTRGLVSSNNQLFKYGIEGKKFPNLQPVVNLIGGFLQWNSSVAKEGLYKDPIAVSKYKGYMREEVNPFGIKFYNKDGSEYPILPLVPRPAKIFEKEVLPVTDTNLMSVLSNSTNCSTSDRKLRWQVYNTATVEGTCSDFENTGQETQQIETASCLRNNVDTLGVSTISITDSVINLKEYINENREQIADSSSDKYIPLLAPYLNGDYPDFTCNPNFNSECTEPELISHFIQVQDVANEQYATTYNENVNTYPRNIPPTFCQPYQQDTATGVYTQDTAFETDYALTTVYKRTGVFQNESCVNAPQVLNNNPVSQGVLSYYHNYYGALTQVELIDATKTITVTNTNFLSGLHKGALWFKANKNGRDKIIFEITSNSQCIVSDDIPSVNSLRYSIFANCSSTAPLLTNIISTSTGTITLNNISTYPDSFYIAVEAPIVATTNSKYRTAPPCGCFSIYTRDLQVTGDIVTFDSMIFQKINTYQATCTYKLPEINECFPIPYQYGDFSYWESTDNYPDNLELYNSSILKIKTQDLQNLSVKQRQDFANYYTIGSDVENNYILLPETNLVCQPIKHYKLPSNMVSPFMGTIPNAPFSEALIFPLGINIDNAVINTFLDIAVNNKLLTPRQRFDIAGYEIVKGDNSIHKSIVANTIGFDMYKYTEKGSEVLYPNYPLNDLGQDLLQTENGVNINHPFGGISNYNFSVLSPELSLSKPTLPTELIVSGYQQGNSRGYFNEVDNHPKMVLLTSQARTMATILGTAEAVLEAVIEAANINVQSNQWQVVGTGSSGGNFQSWASQIAAIVASVGILANTVLKAGQYRLQWLETIENLGQPKNYSSYYVCEGYNNLFLKNTMATEILRGVSVAKYLKEGRVAFKDEHTNAPPIKINNKYRENSVFISTGSEYPITYPDAYASYDNNTLSLTQGSRTIVSQNGGEQGEEVIRRSAMPYITLKNYIPNQFGGIDSIKWLTTSYRKLLTDITSCEVIYGGTVFISRDYQERKHSIFRTDVFGQPDLTPFNYSRYKNVGTPKYFVDYRTGGQDSGGGIGDLIFPDINSEFNLDNKSESGFYVRESSKFYLYYYGFVSYLVESEINTNFRYGRRSIEDQYYPDIQGDMEFFTQQKNRRITNQPTYFYNNVYSRPVTQTPYFTFPVTYSKEIYDKINNAENGIIYSLQDNSENDLTDPWLVFLPLNRGDIETKHGKLISLEDMGSQVILARTVNTELLLNSVDSIARDGSISVELGTGGVFSKRPLEYLVGTQNTDYLKTKYGNFSVDARKGQIFQRSGQESQPISDVIQNRPSGMKNWFRNHLPYKILKYFPDADIDNKYRSLGISMGVDNKLDRIFITKKDYIPTGECIQYDEELGFVINESLCGEPPEITCPEGYTYNSETQMCEAETSFNMCPIGYTYNPDQGNCVKISSTIIDPCPPAIGYYVGGVFNFPTRRLYNSVNSVPAIENGNITVFKRQADGKILVGGSFTSIVVGGSSVVAKGLFRMNFDGTYDSSFNVGTGFTGAGATIWGIDIYSDGRILVGGDFTTFKGEANNRGIIRLTDTGDKDTTFVSGSGFSSIVRDVKVVEGEKILAASLNITYQGQPVKGIIKLMPNGDIDPTFQGGSRFQSFVFTGGVDGNNNWNGVCYTIELQKDGKYLLGGIFNEYNGVLSRRIIRLNVNGEIDTTFTAGEGFLDIPSQNFQCIIYNIQMQGNKILAAGRFKTYKGQIAEGIVRLDSNGNLDPTFNNAKVMGGSDAAGRVVYDFDTDQGGEILLGGSFTEYDNNNIRFIALTDKNGFLKTLVDPDFDSTIFSVLNQPKCQECPDISCVQEVLPTGQILCNCPEYIPALICSVPCGSNNGVCTCSSSIPPTIQEKLTPIEVSDPSYFKDVSWTISYSPTNGSWKSYHSSTPDYYMAYDEFFDIGFNYSKFPEERETIWTHPLTNRSFQVFQGRKQDFIVEYPIVSTGQSKILNNISLNVEARHYSNEFDYADNMEIGFNLATIYNNNNNSGALGLNLKKTSQDISNYPNKVGNTQNILYTAYRGMHTFNYIYNRVKDQVNNVPIWIRDENDIIKNLNNKAVAFGGKSLLERLRGEYFLTRLTNNKTSQYQIILKNSINEENNDS